MCARQDAHLARNRSYLTRVTAIDAWPAAQNSAANDLLFEVLEQLQRGSALLLVREEVDHLRLCRVEPIAPVLLTLLPVGPVARRIGRTGSKKTPTE